MVTIFIQLDQHEVVTLYPDCVAKALGQLIESHLAIRQNTTKKIITCKLYNANDGLIDEESIRR